MKHLATHLIVAIAICCLGLTLQAQTPHSWTGAMDSSWYNPGNWNPASVPDSLDPVDIPNVGVQPVSIPADSFATANSIKIHQGAHLFVREKGDLQLEESMRQRAATAIFRR